MKKRHLVKQIILTLAVLLTVCFTMPFLTVKADGVTTLLTGREINEILKNLAGDTLPEDKSITSLYLVKDTKITGIEQASEITEGAVTASLSSDGTVIAWLDKTVIKWYSNASTVYMNADSSYMFYNFTALNAVSDFTPFDSGRIENTSYMFANDSSFVSLDVTSLSTAKVKNMKAMFAGMTSLSSLNINNFVTTNTTDMSLLLQNDAALTTMDLSSFTVSAAATTIDNMFSGCSGLSKIYVNSDWKADISTDQRMIRVFTAWFNQNLTMAQDTDLKDITFTYSITKGEPVDESATSTKIYAGIITDNCMVTSSHFTSSDRTVNGTPNDPNFAGKKYMTKAVKVIVDVTQFKEPGLHRYLINETTSLEGVDAGLFQLDVYPTRVLDILAEYTDDNTLTASTGVLHKQPLSLLLGQAMSTTDEKNAEYNNQYLLTTNDLIIRNNVSGNQSDLRHVFNYTFTLDGDIAGRELTVMYSDGTTSSITIDANKHGTLSFTLTGKEHVTIKDIQKGSTYTITAEKAEQAEQHYEVKTMTSNSTAEYSEYVALSTDDEETCYVKNTNVNEDVDVTFLNIKDGIVPTGVLLDTSPYVLSVLIGAAGICVIHRKEHNNHEEEPIT